MAAKGQTDAQRAERAALAGRMKGARLQTAVRLQREITKEEMARLIRVALKRPFHYTQWRRYEAGTSEPSLEILRVTAHVSGMAECDLAFGHPPAAGAPPPHHAGHEGHNVAPPPKQPRRVAKPREIDPAAFVPVHGASRKRGKQTEGKGRA